MTARRCVAAITHVPNATRCSLTAGIAVQVMDTGTRADCRSSDQESSLDHSA